jgi:phosphopantetheine adenylyltransferase
MQTWDKKIHVQSSLPAKENQYTMFIGRWQPLHPGHQALFQGALDEGKKVITSDELKIVSPEAYDIIAKGYEKDGKSKRIDCRNCKIL